MKHNYICFDLEGPLTPQDNAYDLMSLFPSGDKIFEVISRYDDLLTMEGRQDYEPGDTLALIIPFLLLHDISEDDIAALARKATLTGGAKKLISWLVANGWQVFCISTTYEQYAWRITKKLGIDEINVACTNFPLDELRHTLCKIDTPFLKKIEEDILKMSEDKDDLAIKHRLDDFFWHRLPQTDIGRIIHKVKPIGGRRKVEALKKFCEEHHKSPSDWVYIGDSITDFRVLKEVDSAGGLAIAFNANRYALPYATMSLASTHISDLKEILLLWLKNGRSAVESSIRQIKNTPRLSDRKQFHWLADKQEINGIVSIHGNMRRKLRDEAGKLG